MTPAPCSVYECGAPTTHTVSLKHWTAEFGAPMDGLTHFEISTCIKHRRGWAVEVRDHGAVMLGRDYGDPEAMKRAGVQS